MVIEEVVASSREIIVGTPVLYDTSADVPFVGLVILEVPSNPGVAFAELGEGSITVGGDSCVGELEPIVDGPHESNSGDGARCAGTVEATVGWPVNEVEDAWEDGGGEEMDGRDTESAGLLERWGYGEIALGTTAFLRLGVQRSGPAGERDK
ncbi:hypothetical protein EV363DRAFT_1419989 [Boletus edulis]|nr:hypothetical protein EV363DRAFT_1419989 [Boletus edulis]